MPKLLSISHKKSAEVTRKELKEQEKDQEREQGEGNKGEKEREKP